MLQPNELIFDSLNVTLNAAQAVDADGKAWVGFSSRTGGAAEFHNVNSWTMATGNNFYARQQQSPTVQAVSQPRRA